jgi:endonuclease/exonuclease/phosphatase family metal-dependent hydrolase
MIRILALAAWMAATLSISAAEATLKVMTYNLRYASDSKPNSWPERRPVMKECLEAIDADIIGTQEGVYHQLKDLEKDLPRYRWLGTGRDGGSKGEFMAIFYKPDRFEPLEFDHFWLSDTPEVIASTTWGHSNRRMVTWVRFKDHSSGREFYLANTHFDHQVQTAREKAAELLLARMQKLDANLPMIVLGDFNARAGANKTYDILTQGGFLADTWHTAQEKRGDAVATFNGFRPAVSRDDRIDWVLARNADALWTQIDTCTRNSQIPSDHFPVIAEIRLK